MPKQYEITCSHPNVERQSVAKRVEGFPHPTGGKRTFNLTYWFCRCTTCGERWEDYKRY